MNAAVAEAMSDVPPTNPAVVAAMSPMTEIGGLPVTQEVFDEARAGAERLLKMPPTELRDLIARRVKMLDTELSEREARRAAIDEAMVAQRVLAARRQRARKMRKRVNIGSSLVAAMFTGLVVVSMF
jgi:hypothetical protein